jgi:hypothetical protein
VKDNNGIPNLKTVGGQIVVHHFLESIYEPMLKNKCMIEWWVDKSIPPLSEIMLCITHFVSVLPDRLTEVQWKA